MPRGLAAARRSRSITRCGGEPTLAPVGMYLDAVTTAHELLHCRFRQSPFDYEHARARGARSERDWKVLGVPSLCSSLQKSSFSSISRPLRPSVVPPTLLTRADDVIK